MKNIIQKAILMAMEAHKGQVRKGDGKTPYVLHPLEVGILISNYTAHEDLITIAILHDVIEDGKIKEEKIKEEFGEDIAYGVSLMTENKNIKDWAERKGEHLRRLSDNKIIYLIKAVDALVNMRDLFRTIAEYGEKTWKKFNAPKESKLAYFEKILSDIKADLPPTLLENYVSALKDLQYSHLLEHKTEEIGFKD